MHVVTYVREHEESRGTRLNETKKGEARWSNTKLRCPRTSIGRGKYGGNRCVTRSRRAHECQLAYQQSGLGVQRRRWASNGGASTTTTMTITMTTTTTSRSTTVSSNMNLTTRQLYLQPGQRPTLANACHGLLPFPCRPWTSETGVAAAVAASGNVGIKGIIAGMIIFLSEERLLSLWRKARDVSVSELPFSSSVDRAKNDLWHLSE